MRLFNRGGLGWGLIEHKWERRTNWALLSGVALTIFLFYIDFKETDRVAIFFLALSSLFHMVARMSHMVEKRKMKEYRPWENKK